VDYPDKTTDLLQVTDKLFHIILYRVHIVENDVEQYNPNPEGDQTYV
jgi:hypothetical protein